MKARIKFRKYGVMKFIGHLDVMRYFQKAMRRADIPISFTGGYSPHMIMSFAQPLGIGLTSGGEYMDVELEQPVSSRRAVDALNRVMVEGVEVTSFLEIDGDKKSSGMTIVAGADYLVSQKEGAKAPDCWKEQLPVFLEMSEIRIVKKTKRSEKEVDIKPMIHEMHIEEDGLFLKLAAGSEENLKPELVMEAFKRVLPEDTAMENLHYHRLELYAKDPEDPGRLRTLESLGWEIP